MLKFPHDKILTYSGTVYIGTNLRTYDRWQFGAAGSDVGRINEVTLRWAQLVLGSVTVSGFNSSCGRFFSV